MVVNDRRYCFRIPQNDFRTLLVIGQTCSIPFDYNHTIQHIGFELRRQSGIVRHNQISYVTINVIRPFGGVNDRAALQRHSAPIRNNQIVCLNTTDGHWQVKFNHIASFPFPPGTRITLFDRRGN
jgi:hypothetical protein